MNRTERNGTFLSRGRANLSSAKLVHYYRRYRRILGLPVYQVREYDRTQAVQALPTDNKNERAEQCVSEPARYRSGARTPRAREKQITTRTPSVSPQPSGGE